MLTQAKLLQGATYWQGILDPLLVPSGAVATATRLADSAKKGDWSTVLMLLENHKKILAAYQWRAGGSSWFSVLHQAAWHGAPVPIVKQLLKFRGLRGLRDAKGRIPGQVAHDRGHANLLNVLEPPELFYPNQFQTLDSNLAALVYGRASELFPDLQQLTREGWSRLLRCPPVEVLSEFPRQRVWFPMTANGGFRITLNQGFLEVLSWNSAYAGSGEAHVVTRDGIIPVDDEFI